MALPRHDEVSHDGRLETESGLSPMTKEFLNSVYDLKTPEETRTLYDAWAASYDDEVTGKGYATPGRIAEALAERVPDKSAPILDYGCGTGLSGLALKLAGFSQVDGADLSSEMLAIAAGKEIYRKLWQVEPGDAIPGAAGDYAAIVATGVIGAGAAPAETFDLLAAALATGGLFALSLNDHTLAEPQYEERIDAALNAGSARLLFKEHGPHLPGIDLQSSVFVLEKA